MGWVVKPPSFDASKKYPLILEIHGGPFGELQRRRSTTCSRTSRRTASSCSYTNPRGSTGYGSEFINGIDHNYPGPDYDDLMAGVDAVVGKGYIDTSRMYVSGCSGGGVLSSWVIGKTDRFAAAAVRCPVIDWIEHGRPDRRAAVHLQLLQEAVLGRSVGLARALVADDGRQGDDADAADDRRARSADADAADREYYAALKVKGVPVKLLQFNEEYHGTGSKPSNYIRTQLYMMSWFNKHASSGRPGVNERHSRSPVLSRR